MSGKKLVLGVGNEILKDDGIGPRVVETLRDKMPIPGVDYCTTTLGGLKILELIEGCEWVILIDAIKTKEGTPGTIYEFTPSDFKETLHLSNLHDVNFLSAIELGKQMGYNIPKAIHIFAIEILEDQVFGEAFSPPLQERFEAITDEIHLRIQEHLYMYDNNGRAGIME
jgi:hydrogenase maturation protease